MKLFRRRSSSRHVAILGCGPAGLFAAHGLITHGWSVSIYSNRQKSTMYGAQYLHAPIPGLTPDEEEPHTVSYKLIGDAVGYREKVYGRGSNVQVSPVSLSDEHSAWDIRAAYDRAWDLFGPAVTNKVILPGEFWYDLEKFDLIVNSIPLPRLCAEIGTHSFTAAQIWTMGDAPARGQYVPYQPKPFTVECNGSKDVGWYRAANVYGHSTMEWGGARKPPIAGVVQVEKPLSHNCDCAARSPIPVLNVGRYGRWEKGVLAHQAYEAVTRL